jgi:sugar phosphate isomerase/epimerase
MKDLLVSAVMTGKDDIALAHAKDIKQPLPGEVDLHFTAPGSGILDFGVFIELLSTIQYSGPLIMHGLDLPQISQARAHMERLIETTFQGK